MLGVAKRCGARLLLTSTSEVYGDPAIHPQAGSLTALILSLLYDALKSSLFFLPLSPPFYLLAYYLVEPFCAVDCLCCDYCLSSPNPNPNPDPHFCCVRCARHPVLLSSAMPCTLSHLTSLLCVCCQVEEYWGNVNCNGIRRLAIWS